MIDTVLDIFGLCRRSEQIAWEHKFHAKNNLREAGGRYRRVSGGAAPQSTDGSNG